jgi:tRNA(Ile)-lysidine synthase
MNTAMAPEDLLPRCAFPQQGNTVACAVSGGADSMALMVLAVCAGLRVTAIHVDHGLRPGSADEADIVRDAASRLGAAFEPRTVTVAAGPNLEARLRSARYGALPAGVLTGHTADDQAETMLLNLMRGAAAKGMAGMRHDGRRPLLRVRRRETRSVCRHLGLDVVDDPSNADPAILRNRVRHELLPLLGELSGRDLVPVLTRQADLWRDDDDLLDELAAVIDPTDARALAGAPTALARRAVRRLLTGEHPPDVATVERVLAVARGEATGCDTQGGYRIERRQQRLRVVKPAHTALQHGDSQVI